MQDLLLDIEAEIPALRRYARVLLHDTDAADDLVQDCLVRALSRLPLWRRPEGNLRAWLFTILRHIQLNQCRSAARHPPPLPLHDDDGPCVAGEQISRKSRPWKRWRRSNGCPTSNARSWRWS